MAQISPEWDLYSFCERLPVMVVTSVSAGERYQTEIWPDDGSRRVYGQPVRLGPSGPSAQTWSSLAAVERHFALAGTLESYRGPVPSTAAGLSVLAGILVTEVSPMRPGELLVSLAPTSAQAFLEAWGLIVRTTIDGGAARTEIVCGNANFRSFGDPLWTSHSPAVLAGKELAMLLNALSSEIPPETEGDARAACAIADQASIVRWLGIAEPGAAIKTGRAGDPSLGAATREVWCTPLPDWQVSVMTSVPAGGPAITRLSALGGRDRHELWRVTHPATALLEDAHEDLTRVLRSRQAALPIPVGERQALAVRLLTRWWCGSDVRHRNGDTRPL